MNPLSLRRLAWRSVTLIIAVCCIFSTGRVRAELVDKVVAVVNNEPITLSEVDEQAAGTYQNLEKEYSGQKLAEAVAEARQQVLDTMIDRRLINQKAKQFNTTVTEEEVEAAYQNTRQRMSLDPDRFREKLAESGLSEETYREQLRDQILQSKLVNYDVRAKVVVTEEMMKRYFDEHFAAKAEKGSYYLLQMGFSWKPGEGDPETARAEARKKAQDVHDRVRGGEDFQDLARKFSDLPSASDGGDIGILALDDMAPVMRDAISPLKPGEMTDIIETDHSFQFYKILAGQEKEKASSASYEAVKDDIREKLYDEKMKAAYSEWVKKLREDAFIKKLL